MTNATCSIGGCEDPAHCRGLCNKHYLKARRAPGGLTPLPPKVCSVEGCGEKSRSNGMCRPHLRSWEKYGDPLAAVRRNRDADERFWEKVNKNGPVPDYAPHLGPCWLWLAAKHHEGLYGVFTLAGGRQAQAHRFSYSTSVGPIPDELVLDHLCRVRHCVRPSHLEAVPQRINILRGVGIQAKNAVKTHCIRGHEFTLENTHIRPNGGRACRACQRLYEPAPVGNANARKTHCPKGHEYTEDNTYRSPSRPNIRICRACHFEFDQARNAAARARTAAKRAAKNAADAA